MSVRVISTPIGLLRLSGTDGALREVRLIDAPTPEVCPGALARTARELRLKKRRDRREQARRQPELAPWEQERDYRPIRTRRDGRIGCLGVLEAFMFITSSAFSMCSGLLFPVLSTRS